MGGGGLVSFVTPRRVPEKGRSRMGVIACAACAMSVNECAECHAPVCRGHQRRVTLRGPRAVVASRVVCSRCCGRVVVMPALEPERPSFAPKTLLALLGLWIVLLMLLAWALPAARMVP